MFRYIQIDFFFTHLATSYSQYQNINLNIKLLIILNLLNPNNIHQHNCTRLHTRQPNPVFVRLTFKFRNRFFFLISLNYFDLLVLLICGWHKCMLSKLFSSDVYIIMINTIVVMLYLELANFYENKVRYDHVKASFKIPTKPFHHYEIYVCWSTNKIMFPIYCKTYPHSKRKMLYFFQFPLMVLFLLPTKMK
jgi:hypothetical protein